MQSLASTLHFGSPEGVTLPPPEEIERERQRRLQEEQDELRRTFLASKRRKVRIPLRYDKADIAECVPEVRDYASSLLDGGHGWLLLDGLNGRGKTYHSCAVLNHVWKQRDSAFYAMQEILDDLKATFDGTGSYRESIDRFSLTDVLVVDDFGKEQATEWSLPVIFEMFRKRESNLKPTIITTNMDASGLYEHGLRKGDATLSESILSRFGEVMRVTLEGKDRRLA